ncbi:PTS fructose transporter subunit IIBC, partial [Staphylococcus aureus]|nr:PTS fructose transporter subunit IIBC [Staphylococcus aureus]
ITEGAIPFAVADPLRVIPSLIIGSATAAAISMGAGVTSLAPHGGIWILFIPNVINHLVIYIIAIISGTIVTALSVGFLKKR